MQKNSLLKKLPNWYRSVFGIVFILFIAVNIAYFFGSSGIKSLRTGIRVKFDRKFDFQLFEINQDYAFLISDQKYFSVVKYKKGLFPFCLICGDYEPNGTIVNGVAYFKDGWLYSAYPGIGPFDDAFHISTGKTLRAQKNPQFDDPLPLIYQKNNLVIDKAYALSVEKIADQFPPLSTLKESCLVFNAAFLLWFMVLIPIGLFYLIKPKKSV